MATFQGGVFSKALKNDRAAAEISVDSSRVRATTTSGEVFSLHVAGLQLELGGASGKMIFCRHQIEPEVTLFCEAPGFFEALRDNTGGQLQSQVDAIAAQQKGNRQKSFLAFGVVIAIVVALFFGFSMLVSNTVDMIPYSVDESIGELASGQMISGMGTEVKDPVVNRAIQQIVDRLAPHSSLEGVTYDLKVIENDMVNAFALPGGYMVVFTGLIDKSDRYEEVAAVIGHEMAHVTQRHGLRRIVGSVGIIAAVQLVLGDISGAAVAFQELFTMAAINGYSRDQESEADAEGVRMLHAAGIDPTGAVTFFEKMHEDASDLEKSGALDWISTHPDHLERIDDLNAHINGLGPFEARPLELEWDKVKTILRPSDTSDNDKDKDKDQESPATQGEETK